MVSVLGIVAEYNPFHNGHSYHILESKKIAEADTVVCVMSGNFTQRGEPAIVDKWARAQMALEGGADIVIELPTIYSVSSAEHFATGSIRILNSLGVDYVSFGSECGSITLLESISNILCNEPKEYSLLLKHELSKGVSYPKARENALLLYLNDIRKYANVLSGSNNILGIEYIKAINNLRSSIIPITIERSAVSHNSNLLVGNIASSSAIRKLITKEKKFQNFISSETFDILDDNIKHGRIVEGLSAYEKQIICQLRKMSAEDIANIPDVSEGLEHKIKNAANECNTASDLIRLVKSKRYTETRIQRILIYTMLGITKDTLNELYNVQPYIRILGMNEKGKEFLSLATYENRKLQFITSVKDFMDKCKNKELRQMLSIDILATNLYTLGFDNEPYANLDFTKKIIIK